jgi:hypothetical protein
MMVADVSSNLPWLVALEDFITFTKYFRKGKGPKIK